MNSIITKIKGWSVHLLTSIAAVLCLLALNFIHLHEYINAFWALTGCLFIDAIDGTLARKFNVKDTIPQIDGAMLDNLVDFVAYVIVPAFFMITYEMFPEGWNFAAASMVIIASCYQFTHVHAKTKDNFFTGYPSYWNLTVFYMFIVDGGPIFNLSILMILLILVFVPVKYIYLSRMDNVTNSKTFKRIIYLCTTLFGISSAYLLIFYHEQNDFFFIYTFAYIIPYFIFSMYRTLYPVKNLTNKREHAKT